MRLITTAVVFLFLAFCSSALAQNIIAGTNASVGVTAAAITTATAVNNVMVQADPDNAVDVFVGSSTSQPVQLQAGQSVTIWVRDVALIFARTPSSTATVNWLGVK